MTPRAKRKNWSFKQKMKRSWPYAAGRAQMCEVYRKARRDNPAMARLLYARTKAVEKRLFDQVEQMIFTSAGVSDSVGGLAELLQ